jgi:arylamine N-acetyltransferase
LKNRGSTECKREREKWQDSKIHHLRILKTQSNKTRTIYNIQIIEKQDLKAIYKIKSTKLSDQNRVKVAIYNYTWCSEFFEDAASFTTLFSTFREDRRLTLKISESESSLCSSTLDLTSNPRGLLFWILKNSSSCD